MSSVCIAGHLEGKEETEDADSVETVKYLQYHLFHVTSPRLCHLGCDVIIVMLGPVGQTSTAVVLDRAVVWVHGLESSLD